MRSFSTCSLLVLGIVACTSISACSSTTPSGPNRELTSASSAPVSSYTPFNRSVGKLRVVACLRKVGIDARFDQSDGAALSGASSQKVAQKALARCEKQAGFPSLAQITNSELAYLYRKTIDERNCLVLQGQAIDPMPSWPNFKQNYLKNPFLPYEHLRNMTPSDLAALERACPEPDL